MTDPIESLIATVNCLREQSHLAGTELTAEAASQMLHDQVRNGRFPGLSVKSSDIDSAVAQSFAHPAMIATASSALAVLWDVTTQIAQFTVAVGLAITLAGTLCLALMASSRQFSRSARTSREAAQAPSLRSVTTQIQSLGRDPKPASRREQMVRDINKKLQPDK